MQDLSLHILDIVENSICAGAKNIEISVTEDLKKDLLIIEITDDGKGMDKEFAEKALDPFVTTRTERKVGLGLSLFAEAARMSSGYLEIRSNPQKGTKVQATFQHSHIDRKPLGDVGSTLLTLIAGNPQIDFIYCHIKNGMSFRLDSREIKAQLQDNDLASPEGLKVLRKAVKKNLREFLRRSVA
ncbi:MAG: ATP-binding protein [candidate division KSB1 bacterium]|nr:ATP-binding protein [candidate division KSB1 bacterium]